MFVVTVNFGVAPQHSAIFLARVRQQAADSLREEAGCLRFDVCTAPDDPAGVFLYEIYTDRAAFDLHLASAHFLAFDAEVAPMIIQKDVAIWTLETPES